GFKTEEELDRFVIELSERIGKPVSHARPIVDATLPDGSRINIVFGADVSLKGSNFTIRKFSKKPISVIQLIKWGTLDERVAAYLWILLLEGMSGFISGETASGKTTSLNAIIAFIRPSAKIITIEDTAEVQVPHENWVRELTRDTGSVESSVTMFDLLKAALRQRPNYIIVGEIRGAEGNVAFQAMQSVAWETPVLIWRETATKPELVPIGEFVDSLYMTSYTNDGKPVMISGNCKVLTLNREGKLSWGNIAYVLRHRVDHAYEIIYGDDYKLIATGSHSVYVLDLNSMLIVPKPVTMIREGDLLVTFKSSLSLNIIHSSRIYDEFLKTLWIKGSNAYVCNTYLKGIIKVLRGIADKYGIDIDVGLRSISEAKHGEDVDGKLHDLVTTVISRIKGLRIKRNDLALLERIKMLVNSDICFLPVKFVRRISYEGYVYDISVPPTELFIGGVKPIALHNTGHPVLATFHAGSVLRLIQRITSPPINVPKTQLDNLNFVIIQSAVYREGVMLRRMLSVNEILGYDAVADSVIYIPVFTWDPSTDRFLFRGRGASYLLEEKIATMRGIPRREIKLIYEELDLRAKILRELVKRNITDYYQVFKIFAKIFMVLDEMLKGKGKEETQYTILEGLENILKLIRRGEFI
ncbi:MAG TPA: hypothetical protein ENF75_03565, partial [Acidilobales archaeon]|nr:hypothetical protein [Acidilobales archaeon]